MTTIADTVAATIDVIAAGPKGPTVGAFFDFDGTLIDGYSATAYFADRLRRGEMRWPEAADILRMAWRPDLDEAQFADAVGRSIAPWAGHPEEELAALWARLFKTRIARLLFPEAWRLVQAHRKMGHTLAIASSATRYQAEPIARELEIAHVLATRATVRDGRLTGGVEGATLWGTGKAEAVRAFATAHGIALAESHGYANGGEDIAFLMSVGHATAVNPKRALAEAAQREGWPVLRFAARRKASAATRVRSVVAYGALAATSLGGLACAVATRNPRRGAELAGSIGSDALFAIAGVRLKVQGGQHLRAQWPAMFLFNHQSLLDGYVMFGLVRRGFTGIAKKEVAGFPLLGQILRGLDFAFIDRDNTKSAIETMQPAVDRLRRGLSVVIAPEGTRSLTPRLGRFKKGAFHIAMQAGVPVVPVVMRNTAEVMTRGSLLLRPGTVQVCVLPPIDVTAWTVEGLDRHVADVQALFQRTLDDWPDAGRG